MAAGIGENIGAGEGKYGSLPSPHPHIGGGGGGTCVGGVCGMCGGDVFVGSPLGPRDCIFIRSRAQAVDQALQTLKCVCVGGGGKDEPPSAIVPPP